MLVALQLVVVAVVPLKLTVLEPFVAPKLVPVIVTDAPTSPELGFRPVILGAGTVTVKATPLLATPPTVTTTFPVVAPAGTATTTLVALQLVTVAAVPLNLTVLVPCVAPKLEPVIVTVAPTNPDVGFKLVMLGAGAETVKLTPLLATPPTVTTTFPVVAPVGTSTTILTAVQLVGVVAVPLNVTVLVPCVAPKFRPVIVTVAPTNPDVGLSPVMLGPGEVTVKLTPLLATPPTVTTTFPVVAPAGTSATMLVEVQLVTVAAIPLNLTVLVPWVAPKFAPAIVTVAPSTPDVGFRLVMLGAGTVTVKLTPALATPPTVTTTFPVVAPVGTVTTMLVALQLVAVAAVPLNLTVLVPSVAPKFKPEIVTVAPTNPDVGFSPVMLGPEDVTVKLTPALATPPTVTTTFPVVAPVGTVTTMLVALQLVAAAAVPLNFTVLVPWVAPKFKPAIVTVAPTSPEAGFRLVIVGTGSVTVKPTPLLATPPTVTTTFPVVVPAGTVTTMLVALQLVAVAAVPLNVTALVPWVAPKFAPAIVTVAPTNPDVGFSPVMLGPGEVTVKLTPLLATPPTVTTTFPVVAPAGTFVTMLVALQLVAVAAIPLNFIVLVPWVAPKFAPAIVTVAPSTPDVGFRLVMLGAGVITVKLTPALAAPPAVTTTIPVVAPVGTVTPILVALQLVAVAATPLNVTVPCVVPKFAPAIVTDAPISPDVGLKLVIAGVVPLSLGLLGVADSTKPEHPVKARLASARTQNRRAHTRALFFAEFAPETILVNIIFFPPMSTTAPKLRPSAFPTQTQHSGAIQLA
jgi:hypothetical protein